MASACDPRPTRIEAMKTVFQKKFDKLRTELKPDIRALNSKLRSKVLITNEVWSKFDIDETLSAVSGRLQNEDMTVSTFNGFCDAVSEVFPYLKTMLLEAVDQEIESATPCTGQPQTDTDHDELRNSISHATADTAQNLKIETADKLEDMIKNLIELKIKEFECQREEHEANSRQLMSELQKKVNSLEEKRKRDREQLSDLQLKVYSLQKEKEQEQGELLKKINSLQTEISELKHSLEQQEVKTKECEERAELYAQEVSKHQEMNEQEKSKTHEAEVRVRCAEKEAKRYQEEAKRYREEAKRNQEEAAELQRMIDDLRASGNSKLFDV